MGKGGVGAKLMAGTEEALEENMELVLEVALKHLWEASADITGQDPNKQGFYTIHDPEFWAQLPTEFLMSTVAGFGGGVLGHMLPFTGGKHLPDEVMPFQGKDKQKLARMAYAAVKGTKMGLKLEQKFMADINEKLEKGELGSMNYTVDRGDDGQFKSKAENPDGITIGDAYYNLMLYQYNMLKHQMSGSTTTEYDEFMTANKDIQEALENGDYMIEKFNAKSEHLNQLRGGVDPMLVFESSKEKKVREKVSKTAAAEKSNTAEEKEKVEVEKKAEVEEKAESGEATEADVKEIKAESPTESNEGKEEEAVEEKKTEAAKKEHENVEEAKRLAGVLNIDIGTAHEILIVEDELQDMLTGVTVERDYKDWYIRSKPELSALWDDEVLKEKYGPDYFDQILKADSDKLREEVKLWEENEVALSAAKEHILSATTLDELLDLTAIVNSDGKATMEGSTFDIMQSKFITLRNELVSEEELQEAKMEIIEKFDLLDPREEVDAKAAPDPNRRNVVTVANELKTKLTERLKAARAADNEAFKKAKKTMIKAFILENSTDIIKVANTRYIDSLDTIGKITDASLDLSGETIIQELFRQSQDYSSGHDMKRHLMDPAFHSISISNWKSEEGLKLTPVFDSDITLYNKDTVSKTNIRWEEMSAKINTSVPPNPKDDIVPFFLRALDTSGPTIKTSSMGLFSKKFKHFDIDDEGNEFGIEVAGQYIGNKDRDMLSRYQDMVASPAKGVYVFRDAEGAKDLVRQLKLRKAMLEVYVGKHDEGGASLMAQVASLRDYNARVFHRADYYSPISDGDYQTYTKFFSNYIIDPVDYVRLYQKSLADEAEGTNTLTETESKRFKVMQARLGKMRFLALPNLDIAIGKAEELVRYADNLSNEAKLEAAYKGGINDYRKEYVTNLSSFISGMGKHLPKEKLSELKAQLIKLEGITLDDNSNDDALKSAYKAIQETNDLMHSIPAASKAAIMEDVTPNTLVFYGELYAAMLVDHNEFYSRLKNLDLEHPSTIKQDRVAFMVAAAIISKKRVIKGVAPEAKMAELEALKVEEIETETKVMSEYDSVEQVDNWYSFETKVDPEGTVIRSLIGAPTSILPKGTKILDTIVQTGKPEGESYDIVTKTQLGQVTTDGELDQAPEVVIGRFDSKESAEEWVKENHAELVEDKAKKVAEITKKYDDQIDALRSKSVEINGLTEAYGNFENFVFVDGAQGTGKTAMIMSMATKVAQDILDSEDAPDSVIEERGDTQNRVLLAANNDTQLNNLVNSANKGSKLAIKKVGENSGMLLEGLYNLLDPEGDIDAAEKVLSDVSIIVYDEATHIQGINKDEKGGDLATMAKGLALINARRKRKITLVAMGDPAQGGWREGMPTAKSEKKEIDYDKLKATERNLGTMADRSIHMVFNTPRLTYSFRSYVSEQENVTKQLLDVNTNTVGIPVHKIMGRQASAEILSRYGLLVNDGDSPKYGGTDFTYDEESIYNEGFVDHLRKQLEDPEFSVVIVTESLDEPLREGSALKALLEEHMDRDGKNSRIRRESVFTVQGSEESYILAILPRGFLRPIGARMTVADGYKYRLMSMIVGRSRYFARVVISDAINIKTEVSKEMRALDSSVTKDFEEKWGSFKNSLLDDLDGVSMSAESDEELSVEKDTEEKGDGGEEGTTTVLPIEIEGGKVEESLDADTEKTKAPIEISPEDTISEEAYAKEIDEIRKEFSLTDNKFNTLGVDELIRIIQKDLQNPSVREDKKESLRNALEAILQTIDSTVVMDNSTDLDNVNETVRILTGKSEDGKPDEVIGKITEESKFMAKKLDELGWGLFYMFNPAANRTRSPLESTNTKRHYLYDAFGADALLDSELISEHAMRAVGISDDIHARDDYEYEIVTHEYKLSDKSLDKDADKNESAKDADEMVPSSVLVATYVGKDASIRGKRFIVARMPSTKMLDAGSNMHKFIGARESELKTAVDAFTDSYRTVEKDKKYNAAQAFGFEEFNKRGLHYVAHMQNTRGKPRNTMLNKLIEDRLTDEGSLGSVYITTDITDIARGSSLFGPTMIGALVTSSESIADTMANRDSNKKSLVDEDGNPIFTKGDGVTPAFSAAEIAKYGQGKAASEVVVSKGFDIQVDAFKEIAAMPNGLTPSSWNGVSKYLAGNDKDPIKYTLKGKDYYIVLTKGMRNTVVPFLYDPEEEQWVALFGMDEKGNFLLDENVDEKSSPLIAPIEAMQNALNTIPTEVPILDRMSKAKSSKDLQVLLAASLSYSKKDVAIAASRYSKFKIASEFNTKGAYQMLGNVHVTVAQFHTLMKEQYKGVQNNPFSFSKPLIFTQGAQKGRAFMLYTYRKNVDLRSTEGIDKIMNSLSAFVEKAENDSSVDVDSVINILEQRQGIGVILLDSPGKNFTDMRNSIPSIVDKKGIAKFNRSSVSINSKASKRLSSMMMELAWAFGNHKGGDSVKISATKNRRLKEYIKNLSDGDRTLSVGKLDVFVDHIFKVKAHGITKGNSKAAQGKRMQERAAATQFINVVMDTSMDSNMGMFRASDAKVGASIKQRSVAAGKKLLNIVMRGRNKDIPYIYSSPRSPLTFYPKALSKQTDGSFAIPYDMTGFNLAAFLRMLSQPTVDVSKQTGKKGNVVEMEEPAIELLHGFFDKVLEDTLMPGTLQKGIFVTPGLVKERGHKAFWDEASGGAELEHELTTTVKSIQQPGITFNIEVLNKAITVKTISVAETRTQKMKLEKQLTENKKSILTSMQAASLAVSEYREGDVIYDTQVHEGDRTIFETDLTGSKVTIVSYSSSENGVHHKAVVKISGYDASGNYQEINVPNEISLMPPYETTNISPAQRVALLEADFIFFANSLRENFKNLDAKFLDTAINNSVREVERFSKKLQKGLKKTAKDIDIEKVRKGEFKFAVDGMSAEESILANKLSLNLPIILTQRQIKKLGAELKAMSSTIDPKHAEQFTDNYKALLVKLTEDAKTRLNHTFIGALVKGHKSKEIHVATTMPIKDFITRVKSFEADPLEESTEELLAAYVTGSDQDREALQDAMNALIADPSSTEYSDNPYILTRYIYQVYYATDHGVDDIDNLPAYTTMKEKYPKQLEEFLTRFPLPAVKPPPPEVIQNLEWYETEINEVMQNEGYENKDKLEALALINETINTQGEGVLSDADKKNLKDMIERLKPLLKDSSSPTDYLNEYVQANEDLTTSQKELLLNLAGKSHAQFGQEAGYALFLEVMNGKILEDGSKEFISNSIFLNTLFDHLEDVEGIPSIDVDFFATQIDTISKFNCK